MPSNKTMLELVLEAFRREYDEEDFASLMSRTVEGFLDQHPIYSNAKPLRVRGFNGALKINGETSDVHCEKRFVYAFDNVMFDATIKGRKFKVYFTIGGGEDDE